MQEEGLDCATNLGPGHSALPAPDGVVQELQGLVGAEMLHRPPPPRGLMLPSQPVLQEAGILREHWACATPGGQSGRQGIRGQLWAWQGTREGQAGEAQLDGEGCSVGSCLPRAGYGGPRGNHCGSLGPSAGSSPCQRSAAEHRWRRNWVPRGCGCSSPSDRAHLYAPTHVARDARPPPLRTCNRRLRPPIWGGGAALWGCVPGCWTRGASRSCPPCLPFTWLTLA